MNVLFRGRDEQFSVIFTEMLSEKVKTVFDVGDEGFLLGKLESPLLQELLHEGFHFVFQDLFGFPGDEKVSGKANEIELNFVGREPQNIAQWHLPEIVLDGIRRSLGHSSPLQWDREPASTEPASLDPSCKESRADASSLSFLGCTSV